MGGLKRGRSGGPLLLGSRRQDSRRATVRAGPRRALPGPGAAERRAALPGPGRARSGRLRGPQGRSGETVKAASPGGRAGAAPPVRRCGGAVTDFLPSGRRTAGSRARRRLGLEGARGASTPPAAMAPPAPPLHSGGGGRAFLAGGPRSELPRPRLPRRGVAQGRPAAGGTRRQAPAATPHPRTRGPRPRPHPLPLGVWGFVFGLRQGQVAHICSTLCAICTRQGIGHSLVPAGTEIYLNLTERKSAIVRGFC